MRNSLNYHLPKEASWVLATTAVLLIVISLTEPCPANHFFSEFEPSAILVVEVDAGFDNYMRDFTAYKLEDEARWFGSAKSVQGLWALNVVHMSHDGRLLIFFDTEHGIRNLYDWAVGNQSTASASVVTPMDTSAMPPELRIRFPSMAVFYVMNQTRSLVAFFLPHSDVYAPEFPLRRVKRYTSMSLTVPNIESLARYFKDVENGETVYMLRCTVEDRILVLPDPASHPYSFDTATGPYMFWWSLANQDQCRGFAKAIASALNSHHYGRFSWRCGDEVTGAALRLQFDAETPAYDVPVPEGLGEGFSPRTELGEAELTERIESSSQLEVLAFCLIDGTVELLIFKGAGE